MWCIPPWSTQSVWRQRPKVKCKQSPQHAYQFICASHGWCMGNSLIFYAVTVNLQACESPFETVTRKGEFAFQLISKTYEVVTGKGEFLFQKFLENENGELVFPEWHLFSRAGHQATQLPATHYSASRSHPTAGNFAKLLHCNIQGKGMYC